MANKRNLFDEMMDGVTAMKAHRAGKITLRSYKVEPRALPANFLPTNAPSKNGSKDAPSPTPKPPPCYCWQPDTRTHLSAWSSWQSRPLVPRKCSRRKTTTD